jgi:hypothetical protein
MVDVEALERVDKRFGDLSTKRVIEDITKYHTDPEGFQDRLVSWSSVLKKGRYRLDDYVKAVEYCTLRAADTSQLDSYQVCFPNRCNRVENGVVVRKPEGTIRALSSLYDKGDLVQGILSQMQIPLHIMFMSESYKAVMKLVQLSQTAESERVQMEAADRLLFHIKSPEIKKVELSVGFQADDTINSINAALDKFAEIAHDRIKAGMVTAVDVIEYKSE